MVGSEDDHGVVEELFCFEGSENGAGGLIGGLHHAHAGEDRFIAGGRLPAERRCAGRILFEGGLGGGGRRGSCRGWGEVSIACKSSEPSLRCCKFKWMALWAR